MTLTKTLLGVAVTMLVSTAAGAVCIPNRTFANFANDESTYGYIHFGPDARQSTADIVGRFWAAGAREDLNEGAYDDSHWLHSDAPDEWWFVGFLGTFGVVGCADGDMVLVLQDTTTDETDALFVAGRVSKDPTADAEYPFYRTELDWNAARFPAACRKHQKRRGSRVTVDLALDDFTGGFYGEPGMLATDTITGYTLWMARGSDPGRSVSLWSPIGRVPYTGASETVELLVDCSEPGDVLIAVGVEFDHGQFTSDFVGRSTRVLCNRAAVDPDDLDSDNTEDRCDNCPGLANRNQADSDHDGLGDACDPCPNGSGVATVNVADGSPQIAISRQPCAIVPAVPGF